MNVSPNNGVEMHGLVRRLFPICRSLTGMGVRETLQILKSHLPGLTIHEVPSGTQSFDWTVPDEWNIRDAYIECPDGSQICRFGDSSLHVLGYSLPVDATMPLADLQKHLYSYPALPDAIPFEASYYTPRWGFCLPHNERIALKDGVYRAYIDSTLAPGHMTYGELLIPGESTEEVLLSTYICHPSMANNELSGPVVSTFLAKWLMSLPRRLFSYRFVFVPETVGALTFLSRNLPHLKQHVLAAFNVTCVGDDRSYSYLPTRDGDTLSDRVALHVLHHVAPGFARYKFLDRGSDERQYCSPGIDLPVVCVMRTKYGEYPEYHTSKDDLTVVTPAGLQGGFEALQRCLECLEGNVVPLSQVCGEPQLGKRGLYESLVARHWVDGKPYGRVLCDLLAYSDGRRDLLSIAQEIEQPMWRLIPMVDVLERNGLLRVQPRPSRPA